MSFNSCPLCKKEGSLVSRVSIDHNIKQYFKKHLKAHEYYSCQNSNCDVVYFNSETDEIYFMRDLDQPIK